MELTTGAKLMAPPPTDKNAISPLAFSAIASRENASDRYWRRMDPISETRLLWRAATVRHMFHLLPGESILVLACGSGTIIPALAETTRGECPITAVTFDPSTDFSALEEICPLVEKVRLTGFPGELAGRQFDYVVAIQLLEAKHAASLLGEVRKLLRPGGQLLFFETNPWNPVFWTRKFLSSWFPFLRRGDERALCGQLQLYELLSELGYVSVRAMFYDFLYRPIPRWLMFPARNLTLILENIPLVRNLAGTILVHAQNPPRGLPRPSVQLTDRPQLHGAVSVVVPCHNEEMNIGPLVEGLLKHYDKYLHEIILVDDNSRDRSRQITEGLAAFDARIRPVFRTPPNGVGRALADGLKHATGRYVLLMDCDFLHILPELREIFDAAAAGADVVLGSRFSKESVLINYPIQKILCNRAFHILLNLLFYRRVRDLTNNLKLDAPRSG